MRFALEAQDGPAPRDGTCRARDDGSRDQTRITAPSNPGSEWRGMPCGAIGWDFLGRVLPRLPTRRLTSPLAPQVLDERA